MSNFSQKMYCPKCETVTYHGFFDDTPTRHRYTVVCSKCDNKLYEGVPYGDWEEPGGDAA